MKYKLILPATNVQTLSEEDVFRYLTLVTIFCGFRQITACIDGIAFSSEAL